MQTVSLAIEGMSCGHCLAAVKKAIAAVPGATLQELQLGSARVAIDEQTTTPDAVVNAITDAGYQAHASV